MSYSRRRRDYLRVIDGDMGGADKDGGSGRVHQLVRGAVIAPLRVTNACAKVPLEDNGEPILADVPHGRGRVVALGDPWLYNEYIHSKDNYRIAKNLFRWLLRNH